jgi:predicted nucleic acid-binding protein
MVSPAAGVGAEVVLDANVVGALGFIEPGHGEALAVFSLVATHSLIPVVPDLFWAEFQQICGKKLHVPGLSLSYVDKVYEDALELPLVEIAVLAELRQEAWRLRRSLGVGSYDSYYLALALQLGTDVWTLDREFRDRASADASIAGRVKLIGADVLT